MVAGPLSRQDVFRRASRRVRPGWVVSPSLILVGCLLLFPLVLILILSFTEPPGGFVHYKGALTQTTPIRVLKTSAAISLTVTVVSAVIGYSYAYVAVRSGRRLRSLLLGAAGASLFLSVIVRAFALLVLLQSGGAVATLLSPILPPVGRGALVHSFAGVVIGMAQYAVPLMVLAVYDVMRRLDQRLLHAASVLGAGPLRRFYRIYLPLTLPGIASGSVIVFITVLGYYQIPAILGGPQNTMVSQYLTEQIGGTLNWGLASAVATILLVGTVLAFSGFMRLSRSASSRS